MRRFIVLLFGCVFAARVASAQTTNIPLTRIEALEAHTQTIIIKGFAPVGSLTVNDVVISVRIKATTEVNTGRKLGGLAIEIAGKQQSERIIVDYDELGGLLNGVDFMSKADYDVSPLQGFDAGYTTRAGLRVGAFTSKRSETIQPYLSGSLSGRLYFTGNQLAEFRDLLQQAKTNLDSLMPK